MERKFRFEIFESLGIPRKVDLFLLDSPLENARNSIQNGVVKWNVPTKGPEISLRLPLAKRVLL